MTQVLQSAHSRPWRALPLGLALTACLVTLPWLGGSTSQAQTATSAKIEAANQIQAAYIFNFAKFFSWPEGAFPDANAPIVLGIIGKDSFADTVKRVVKDRKAQNRNLVAKTIRQPEDCEECEMIFIGGHYSGDLPALLQRLRSRPVFIIGESIEFARQGGHVGFFHRKDKIHFAINHEGIKASGLKVNAQLLMLARIVKPPENQ